MKQSSARDEIVNFDAAFKPAARDGCKFGQFIKAVLNGEIMPCAIKPKLGIKGLIFPAEQAKFYADYMSRMRKGDLIYLSDAAKLIGVTPKVAFFLKDKGLLPAKKATPSLRPGFLVSRETVEHFKATYVRTSEIARRLQTPHSVARNLLTSAGVWPVCGPTIDGRGFYFFRVSDVEAVNPVKLLAEAKARRQLGRLRLAGSSRVAPIEPGVRRPYLTHAEKQNAANVNNSAGQPHQMSLITSEAAMSKENMNDEIIVGTEGRERADAKTQTINKGVTGLQERMVRYRIKLTGKTLSGHFSPEDAIDVLLTAQSRGRKPGQLVVSAVLLGLPEVKEQKKLNTSTRKSVRSRNTEDLMKKLNVPSKGMTLSGHFSREIAVEIHMLAERFDQPVSQVIKAAIAIGLPMFKEIYPAMRKAA
ncbi:MAG: hypothetical protein ACR2H6_09500 [Pyrinomonadaceae bacterium]